MATVRINDDIKKEVTPILEDLGVSLSEAINMFLHQIKITNSIPFEVKRSNDIDSEKLLNTILLDTVPDAILENMDITEKLMLLKYYAKSEDEKNKSVEEAIPLDDILKSEGLE